MRHRPLLGALLALVVLVALHAPPGHAAPTTFDSSVSVSVAPPAPVNVHILDLAVTPAPREAVPLDDLVNLAFTSRAAGNTNPVITSDYVTLSTAAKLQRSHTAPARSYPLRR